MNKIIQIGKHVLASFDNFSKGASGRKLTAFWIIAMLITPADYYYIFKSELSGDVATFNTWLLIHFTTAAFFLGLVTWQQLSEIKNNPLEMLTSTKSEEKTTIIKKESTTKESTDDSK